MRHPIVWMAVVLSMVIASPLTAGEPGPSSLPATPSQAATAEQLKAKLAELDALQREIDELRKVLGQRQQLLISLKCIEVNVTKRDDFGFEFVDGKKRDGFGWSMLDQAYGGYIEALLQNDIAKVVCEPTLLIWSGCKGHFESGGEIPLLSKSGKIEYQKYGTKVEVQGIVTPQQRIRLELRMQNREVAASSETTADGNKNPALNRRMVDIGVEIAPGETFVLRSPRERKDQVAVRDDSVTEKTTTQFERLWLIKAELAD